MKINSINELKRGDLVIYRSGRINYVNKPFNYKLSYENNFENKTLGKHFDIIAVKRYIKIGFFYVLKTVFKKSDKQ